MYKTFYGLKRSPFEISPDPQFLFPTLHHREALASIYYGICRRKGFVVMTGEVGTGKTLLVRCLLELLNRQQIAFANVFNAQLSDLDFLRYIAGDLGLKLRNQPKSELLLELNHYLIERHRNGQTTVLVVDEAQHLSAAVLEEIRLLTNLETSQQKLLQILLVGQPELEEKLESHDLRQLKQRIGLRCRLESLTVEETRGYIARRLRQAGAGEQAEFIFPAAACTAIHRCSGGIPRLINTICENALITAFAARCSEVKPEMVEEIAREFRLGVVKSAPTTGFAATPVITGPVMTSEQESLLRTFLNLLETLERSSQGRPDGVIWPSPAAAEKSSVIPQ
ncbi:MAG TPA: AAA family ATPase [Candidatus Sulfotelmatobacter sp.]|jgi:type II secretory pathway predicted ATPase ExeA